MSQEPDALRKTNLLFHPQSVIPKNEVNLQEDHLVKRVLSFIGGLIGIYGAWIFIPIAEKSWAPIIGSDENWQKALAVISLISISPVTFTSTESSVGKFCSAVWNLGSSISTFCKSCGSTDREDERVLSKEAKAEKEIAKAKERSLKCKRVGAAILSTFLAACYAVSQAEIAWEFLDVSQPMVKLNLSAQIMATFSLVFLAVDELLLDRLKVGNPRTPFLTKIDTINKKIDSMPKKVLSSLVSCLQEDPALHRDSEKATK